MVINCAFIGFGKSTTRYHLPYVLNRKDSWHVAHIFRRHAKPEEQAPIYSHIHFTSDLDEVLNDPDVKLVVVCTHADSHFEYAKRALEAGKNVLVEKPFTPTLAQAKELFALAKSKGLTVTPYQNRRFDSCFLTAKKAIESGKLGEIVEVESHFDYYRPVAETKPGPSYAHQGHRTRHPAAAQVWFLPPGGNSQNGFPLRQSLPACRFQSLFSPSGSRNQSDDSDMA